MSSIFNEYVLYASPKSRLEDQQMIEIFDINDIDETLNGLEDEERGI